MQISPDARDDGHVVNDQLGQLYSSDLVMMMDTMPTAPTDCPAVAQRALIRPSTADLARVRASCCAQQPPLHTAARTQNADVLHGIIREVLGSDSCWLCGAGGAYGSGTYHVCGSKALLWGVSGNACLYCGSAAAKCGATCWYRHGRDRFPTGAVCYRCLVPAHILRCDQPQGGGSGHCPDVVRDIIITLGRNASLRQRFLAWLNDGELVHVVHPPPAVTIDAPKTYLNDSELRDFFAWCFMRATDARRSVNVLFVVAFAARASSELMCQPPWRVLLSAPGADAVASAPVGGDAIFNSQEVLLCLHTVLLGERPRCVFCTKSDCPLLSNWKKRLDACAGLRGLVQDLSRRCTR